MTTMPVEQKVRQLDNDVQALYDLVHKISTTQVRHSNRFDEITSDLAALEGKVDGLDGKVDRVLELLQP